MNKFRLTSALLSVLMDLPLSEPLMDHGEHKSTAHREHIHEELQLDSLLLPNPAAIPDGLTLDVRTGNPPDRLEGDDHGELLATVKIKSVGVSSGEIIFSGIAGHFRVKNSVGIAIAQGPVLSDTESTPDDLIALVMNNTTCVSGGVIASHWH